MKSAALAAGTPAPDFSLYSTPDQAGSLEFRCLNAELIGISVDGIWCHLAFAENRRLHFHFSPISSPRARSLASGVYRDHEGTSERALFVIDEEGVIQWSYVSPVGFNPGADRILRALETLDREDDHGS